MRILKNILVSCRTRVLLAVCLLENLGEHPWVAGHKSVLSADSLQWREGRLRKFKAARMKFKIISIYILKEISSGETALRRSKSS